MPRDTPRDAPSAPPPGRRRGPPPGLAGVLGALALAAPPPAAAPPVTDPAFSAQPPARAAGPRLGARARPCDGRFAMLMIAVRDAAGAPVTGARLATRRAGAREPFPVQPQEHGGGDYQLLDDTALRYLAGGDQALELTVAHGGRRRVVRQVVGTSPGGCHVVRRSGADVVTLP